MSTLALVLVAFVSIVVYVGVNFASFHSESSTFDSHRRAELRAEIDGSADPGCVLGPMTKDLLSTKALQELPRVRVVELLGDPTAQNGSMMVYDIGQCHGWEWHSSELVLHVGSNGFVVRVEVRRTQ